MTVHVSKETGQKPGYKPTDASNPRGHQPKEGFMKFQLEVSFKHEDRELFRALGEKLTMFVDSINTLNATIASAVALIQAGDPAAIAAAVAAKDAQDAAAVDAANATLAAALPAASAPAAPAAQAVKSSAIPN